MPYVLRLDRGTKCILVYPSGHLSASDIDDGLKEILALRRDQGVDRILCDQRGLESAPSLPDIYKAATTFADGSFRGMRIREHPLRPDAWQVAMPRYRNELPPRPSLVDRLPGGPAAMPPCFEGPKAIKTT